MTVMASYFEAAAMRTWLMVMVMVMVTAMVTVMVMVMVMEMTLTIVTVTGMVTATDHGDSNSTFQYVVASATLSKGLSN